jgi:hypothetical protein
VEALVANHMKFRTPLGVKESTLKKFLRLLSRRAPRTSSPGLLLEPHMLDTMIREGEAGGVRGRAYRPPRVLTEKADAAGVYAGTLVFRA